MLYRLELMDDDQWKGITSKALRGGFDGEAYTSYAGRRNAERDHLITPDQEKQGTMVICDDDDGPLHHPSGIIAGYSNNAVRLLTWDELEMERPEDADDPEPFLGDEASNLQLAKLWGH